MGANVKRALILITLLLSACGSEQPAPATAPVTPYISQRYGGYYISSQRDGDHWTVATTAATFKTFTSLRVAANAAVLIENHQDPQTSLTLGELLVAEDKRILVAETHWRGTVVQP